MLKQHIASLREERYIKKLQFKFFIIEWHNEKNFFYLLYFPKI